MLQIAKKVPLAKKTDKLKKISLLGEVLMLTGDQNGGFSCPEMYSKKE